MTESDSHSARRQQILRAAERLLRHYGFSKTTVSDIAAEASIGVGTVYLEFSSKNDIIGALAQERHQRLLDTISAAIEEDGPFGDRLRTLLDARIAILFEVASEGPHGTDLISCSCPSVDLVKARFRAEEERLMIRFLEAAHQAGEFSVPSPASTVRAIIRIYDGFSPAMGCHRTLAEVEEELLATHQLILNGLRAR